MIGGTVTLENIGDTIMLTGQVTLTGPANNGNVLWRIGLYYKGTNPTATGWAGYMIGQVNYNGPGEIYIRNISNSGIYGSGSGCTMRTTTEFLFSPTWGQGTYDIMLSVTKTGPAETLMRWKLVGQSLNTYTYAGRATNSSATAMGGFSFDHVGFLSGGGVWGGPNGVIAYSNLVVVVGRYSDGSWTNDADGMWSDTGNWAYGAVANGAGFVAAFDQVNLTADRVVTMHGPRTIGRLVFGSPAGNTRNWTINGDSRSVLTLDRARYRHANNRG